MLTICCLLFIITGIQFWITDYMKVIMQIEESKVFVTFSIVCITAPTLGVLSGGYVIEKLGGYTDKRALDACLKISMLCAVCGLPLPLINNFPLFVVLMWLLLYFGGAIVPGLTGIMLSSISDQYKEVANSITHFCYNLIGYLPSPILYGLVCKYTGGTESRWGLVLLMITSIFGVLFLKKAFYYQNLLEKESESQTHNLTELYKQCSESPLRKTQALTTLYGKVSLTNNQNM